MVVSAASVRHRESRGFAALRLRTGDLLDSNSPCGLRSPGHCHSVGTLSHRRVKEQELDRRSEAKLAQEVRSRAGPVPACSEGTGGAPHPSVDGCASCAAS